MKRLIAVPVLAVLLCACPPGPFEMSVVPEQILDSIPGQQCVFLVTVEDTGEAGGLAGPVALAVSTGDAEVRLSHAEIVPGEVAEVTVIPAAGKTVDYVEDIPFGGPVNTRLVAAYGNYRQRCNLPVLVTSREEDLVRPMAEEVRDAFVPWLSENRPELGITADTAWDGTIVTPHILVVTHYLFFSEEWEMHVYWHVMIAPHDWARIELRRRYEEVAPSLAFEIPSRTTSLPEDTVEITPADTVWR